MSVLQGLQHYNQKMLTMAEHFDQFIMDKAAKQPNVWHDRISRGVYQLFNGMIQKSNVYRGGLPVQAGLTDWKKIQLSKKTAPTFDNCAPGTPQTYTYAWETIQYEGFTTDWQSEPVCLKDLRFIDYAKEQLGMVVRSGVDFGTSILENWNREMYIYQAVNAGRTAVLCEGALSFEDSSTYRFTYDPFVVDSDGDTYISFADSLKISTLNWSYLDYIRQSLSDRAGEAALGRDSNMAMYGLMIDYIDFERFVLENDKLREDFRFAKPQDLIQGYNMGFKSYRGFILMHDPRQMRFKFSHITSDVVYAKRVKPLKAGRAVTIGQVPEPNPEYYRAELAIGVIFMNEVFQNLFAPNLQNLGSGMVFGPAPGFTGEWQWINIKSPTTNMLGESGFFYGRFEIWPKPLMYSAECTVFLYRRCPQSWRTGCEIQTRDDVGVGAVAMAAVPVAGDFDSTTRTVTLTLAKKLAGGVGDTVTINTDDGDDLTAVISSDALAPTYTFAWESGASNAPSAVTELDDPAIVTVTVA